MKLEKMAIANASALAIVFLWVICSITAAILPAFSYSVTQSWMHGLALSPMGGWNLNLYNFLLGGISLIVVAWVSGYIFGWSWEFVSKKH